MSITATRILINVLHILVYTTCVNDDSTRDRNGDICSDYKSSMTCGEDFHYYDVHGDYYDYDTENFTASIQCCICGGGNVTGEFEYHCTIIQKKTLGYLHSPIFKGTEETKTMKTKEFVEKMTKILFARPKVVLVMTENDNMTNIEYDESIWFPWIVLTNYDKVAITCPGCGTTHHGLWGKTVKEKARGIGSFTKNLQQPLCCDKMRGRSFTIEYYERFGKWEWEMIDERTINTESYEGFIMDSFIKKNEIKPTFTNYYGDILVERCEYTPDNEGCYYGIPVFPLYYDQKYWEMKAPSKVPPYYNLKNTMD